MCGSDAPPAPKPDPNIATSLAAQTQLGQDYLAFSKDTAAAQTQLGQDYLAFSKEQFAVSQERQAEIDALTKEISTFFLDTAKSDKERYDTVFKPLEDEFIKTAREFDSPERQAEAAAKAGADVQSAAARERGAMERNSVGLGVSPASGRYAGIDRALGLGTALGSVDAQNRARQDLRDKGLELQGQAINLGRGTQATSLQAAGAAANPTLAANQQFLATPGIVASGYTGAQGGLAAGASTVGSGYGTAMEGYQAQAQGLGKIYGTQADIYNTDSRLAAADAEGTGAFLGKVVGTGLSFLSDEDAKTNRKKVPAGRALDAVENMPVESYDYKPGMGDGGSHVGPMAEDFSEATGKGDGKTISVQDAIGFTMKAVQDLSAKVDRMAEMIGLGQPRPATA